MKQQTFRAILVSVFLSTSFCGSARSFQDPNPTPPQQQDPQDNKDPNASQPKQDAPPPDNPAPPVVDNGFTPASPTNALGANANAMQVHQLNGAAPLPTGRVSLLQFGPIYLQSADFLQTVAVVNATTLPNPLYESVSMFRADVVFDHAWRTSRFSVQYEPRLYITNGQVQTDTSNLNAAWTTVFVFSPRFSMALKNTFGYFGQQDQFDNLDLEADLTTGALVEAHFLEGPGHFLNDRSEADFRYLISPRDRIDFTPFFNYYSASGGQDLNVNEAQSPGGEFDYVRLLTPTRTIGLGYTIDETFYGTLLPTTLYQTADVTYAQQLSPTWRFAATVGVTRVTAAMAPAELTWTGDFNAIKKFRNSTLAFQYYRGQDVGLQITNGIADRFDTSYARKLYGRSKLILGGGYYRQLLAATDTRGAYGSVGMNFQVAARWFIETGYTYKNQQNGGANFASGNLNYGSIGIRWEPGYQPQDLD